MRLLIIKLGSIGDIIHTLPALDLIRRSAPGAEVSWVVESRSAELLRENPLISRLIEVDTRSLRGGKVIEDILIDLSKQATSLRGHDFDLSIDFQGLLKSAAIGKIAGAKKRWGFSKSGLREPLARFLLTDKIKTPKKIHVIEKNRILAAGALGVDIPTGRPEFPIKTTDEHKEEASRYADLVGSKFVILNPAGGWATKLWPAENYGRLGDLIFERLGYASVVTTGPGEEDLAGTALAASRSGRVVSATPSLKGFYELAKLSSGYVGGDTGPTHLAIAAGTPIVGIFGPTEWWRNGSPFPDDICVERNEIDCRVDCHRRTCSNWICMDIEVETVFRAVEQRLGMVSVQS
jgi:heptosyltransferase I